MTRDEAIRQYWASAKKHNAIHKMRNDIPNWVFELIDGLVAIGVLKVDDPKTPLQRMSEACRDHGITASAVNQFCEALEHAGLMVATKDGKGL